MLLIKPDFPRAAITVSTGEVCFIQNLPMGCFAVWSSHVTAAAPRWLREWPRPHACVPCLPAHLLSDGTFGCEILCSNVHILKHTLL